MHDVKLLDSLHNASSLELFRLKVLIETLLADPKRIITIRKHLILGQAVRYFDFQKGELQEGRITAMGDRQVTIQEQGSRRAWKLPYIAIELAAKSESGARPTPQAVAPVRGDFHRGDQVSFEDRYLRTHIGHIVRINSRTATVEAEGSSWRVSFALLRPVIDAR
jgi:hypothetical protein